MSSESLTLYTFETPQGFFNMSPFCVKADILLKMANLPFNTELPEDYKVFSKGKLPVLKDGDTIIQDSEFIRRHITDKYGETLDGNLTAQDKATGHALIRMLEERTIMGLVQGRWIEDAGWEVLEPLFFGELPANERTEVGKTVREQVSESLKSNGFGQHTHDEQHILLSADIAALATLLNNRDWFFSDQPTYIDAAVFGMLVNFYAAPVPTPMAALMAAHDNLVAYVNRGLEQWYPDVLKMMAAE
ncbi:glutathione S-transferase family protein [Kordiimonas aquimaris]|uniref:glutathione S-transferase family protein n=1 Tax=Kordiimonas aquimaris TaxID=707591 RepID=UPI0021CF8248|nr:glutathione S-transferase family protein [Kordiimonas aquimaris]